MTSHYDQPLGEATCTGANGEPVFTDLNEEDQFMVAEMQNEEDHSTLLPDAA